jgi:hypothetical protein
MFFYLMREFGFLKRQIVDQKDVLRMSPFFVKLIRRFLIKLKKRQINLTKRGKDP